MAPGKHILWGRVTEVSQLMKRLDEKRGEKNILACFQNKCALLDAFEFRIVVTMHQDQCPEQSLSCQRPRHDQELL